MGIRHISFDENMEMSIYLESINSKVCLALSDGLNAYEEDLINDYMGRIIDFLEHCTSWYSVAVGAVLERSKGIYNMEIAEQDVKLMSIFILFEQHENPLFGLSFRTEFDVEHGCGLKISGDNYDVVEIGNADVAFC